MFILRKIIPIFLLHAFFSAYASDVVPFGPFDSCTSENSSISTLSADGTIQVHQAAPASPQDSLLTSRSGIEAGTFNQSQVRTYSKFSKMNALGAVVSVASCVCGIYLVTQNQQETSGQQFFLEFSLLAGGFGGFTHNAYSIINALRQRFRDSAPSAI